MQVQFKTTTNHRHPIAPAKSGRSPSCSETRNRPLSWKPQASSLTRDETRELVLEMIG